MGVKRLPQLYTLQAAIIYSLHAVSQQITLRGVDIMMSNEAMCLGVLLHSPLIFAPHAQRLFGRSFYHLWQMNTVRKSLTEDAAMQND